MGNPRLSRPFPIVRRVELDGFLETGGGTGQAGMPFIVCQMGPLPIVRTAVRATV